MIAWTRGVHSGSVLYQPSDVIICVQLTCVEALHPPVILENRPVKKNGNSWKQGGLMPSAQTSLWHCHLPWRPEGKADRSHTTETNSESNTFSTTLTITHNGTSIDKIKAKVNCSARLAHETTATSVEPKSESWSLTETCTWPSRLRAAHVQWAIDFNSIQLLLV